MLLLLLLLLMLSVAFVDKFSKHGDPPGPLLPVRDRERLGKLGKERDLGPPVLQL